MEITKDFKKALIWLVMCSLLVTILSKFLISFFDNSYEYLNIFFTIRSLILMLFFWLSIIYVTKNVKLGVIGFIILNSLSIYNLFTNDNYLYKEYLIQVSYYNQLAGILFFSFFGYFIFKNTKGLWMGLFGLIFTSQFLMQGGYVKLWYGVLGYFLGGIQMEYINGITFVPLIFILFWAFYSILNKLDFKEFDFSFNSIALSKHDRLTSSIIFWVLRIAIVSLIINLSDFFVYFSIEHSLILILKMLSLVSILYFVSLIYRNFLVSFFVNLNIAPGWLYFSLNIPFVNFFVWLWLIVKSYSKNQISNHIEHNNLSPSDQQIKFSKSSKNQPIITLIISFHILAFAKNLLSLNGSVDYDNALIFILSSGLNFSLLLLFITNKNAMYYIIGYQIILLFLSVLIDNNVLHSFLNPSSIISYIILFPLFHFQHLALKNSNEINQL